MAKSEQPRIRVGISCSTSEENGRDAIIACTACRKTIKENKNEK